MANSLGGLRVSLGLDAAEFTTGLTKAEFQAKKFARNLSNEIAIGVIKAEIALKALGEAAAFAIRAFPELIEQAGHFQDLAEKTGASAEALASFSIAAKVAGTSIDDIATFSVKLSKNLVSVDEEASKTAIGLHALGIPIKEFKALDPAAQVDALSKALAKFNNVGGGKAAALESIAKGGASLLPFLKELEESGGRQITLTDKQIQQADAFNDATARSKAQLNAFAQVVAVEASGAVAALAKAVKDFVQDLLGLDATGKKLRDDNSIVDFANNAARALAFAGDSVDGLGRIFSITGNVIGASAAQITALASGDLKAYNVIQESASETIDKIIARQTLRFRLEKNIADQAAAAAKPVAIDKRPSLPIPSSGISAAAEAAALARKLLDGQIKALEANVARERDILSARSAFLRDNFSDGFISLSDYYDSLQKARDENLRNTLAAFDKEISATEAFKKKLTKASDRSDADNKIKDIQEKQANLLRDAATQEDALGRERRRAAEQYAGQLDELNAKMAELAGNTAKAASIRFDTQNAVFNRSLAASGNTEGQAQQAAIKAALVTQSALNDKSREFNIVLDAIGNQQERINILQQTGAISEIEALTRTSALATGQIARLTELADAYAKIAEKSTGIVRDEALQKVEQLRLSILRLGAQTDLLADKFNKTFGDAFSSAFSDFISGTKTAKEAFNDFVKSVTKSISDIASQNIATALFGKDNGILSGVGGFFSKIFGGGLGKDAGAVSGTAGATAADAALTGLSLTSTTADAALATLAGTAAANDAAFITMAASATVVDTAMVTLAIAAETAAAALLTVGASSAASGIGSAIGSFATAASGTDFARGGLTLVGERGPEIVNLPRGSKVTANDQIGKLLNRPNLSIVVNVPQGTSGPSADQIGIRVGAHVQRALARNG